LASVLAESELRIEPRGELKKGPSLYLPLDGRGRREIGAKTESQPLRS
jgi:hypothetical protein